MVLVKLVLLLLAAGVVGYCVWSQREAPVPTEPVVAEAGVAEQSPPAVDFPIKMRVKRILEEWKEQSLAAEVGRKRSSMLEVNAEINAIRQRLYDQGQHDDQTLRDLMVRAAVELGYEKTQAEFLVGRVLAGRSR